MFENQSQTPINANSDLNETFQNSYIIIKFSNHSNTFSIYRIRYDSTENFDPHKNTSNLQNAQNQTFHQNPTRHHISTKPKISIPHSQKHQTQRPQSAEYTNCRPATPTPTTRNEKRRSTRKSIAKNQP